MKYGSLCSGIGGLDLAVEEAFGASPAWFCESDQHAASVLRRWWPDVPVHPDIKTQDWEATERVRLVTAGYPCQPFSHADRRQGASDPRHLWPFVIRAVRLLRPRCVVLENVSGHLGLGFDVVLGDLADAGFDAEWTVVRASDVGACHQRARLFVVAHANRARLEGRPRDNVASREMQTSAHDRTAAADTADDGFAGCRQTRRRRDGFADSHYEPVIRRWEYVLGRSAPTPVDDRGRLSVPFVEWMMGFPEGWVDGLSRTAGLRCLGNAVVPAQGASALRTLLERPE